jgi:hypothetical protein
LRSEVLQLQLFRVKNTNRHFSQGYVAWELDTMLYATMGA